jgi:hypothetical protein
MRFEVPQFIEIEDKIFGPFTWRQFIYLVGGVGFAAVLFLVANFFIFLFIGIPIGGLGVLLAFYQVNNRPFSNYLESIVSYTRKSKLYLWKKAGTGIYHGQSETAEDQSSLAASVPSTNKSNLNSLSRQLELKAIQKET